jgi:hypothetical protein
LQVPRDGVDTVRSGFKAKVADEAQYFWRPLDRLLQLAERTVTAPREGGKSRSAQFSTNVRSRSTAPLDP